MSENIITFAVLQARLILLLNWRIENGEYSERGLARVLGISQTQMHNVRKGARKLTLPLSDCILSKFGLSILSLIEEGEILESLDLHDPDWREKAKRKPPTVLDPRAPWRSKAS